MDEERQRLLPPISFRSLPINSREDEDEEDDGYVDYKRRWYILAVVVIVNVSNAMLWLSFSPIADHTAKFYEVGHVADINWLSILYPIVTVIVCFLASWILDSCGLRTGIILAAWLNVSGSVVRVISCLHFVPADWRFPVALVGQGIAAAAQPFLLIAPTKVAATWFKDTQRATANMVLSMSNPVGILLANVLSPVIVDDYSKVPFMMQMYTIPAALGVVMATVGVCSSRPPTPPSASAEEESEPFRSGFVKLFRNKQFLLLAFFFGVGVALFTALSTLLEQILCPWGYDDDFAGLCGALLIALGVVGAAILGVFVDKTKKFEESAKVAYSFAGLTTIFFALVYHHEDKNALIALSIALFGFFGFALYPVCLELGVECSYPVAEATSSGVLIMSGQIQGIVYILVMQSRLVSPDLSPTSKDGQPVCGGAIPQEYNYATLGFACVASLSAILFTIFFRCPYRRLQTEQQLAAERILHYRTSNASVVQS